MWDFSLWGYIMNFFFLRVYGAFGGYYMHKCVRWAAHIHESTDARG